MKATVTKDDAGLRWEIKDDGSEDYRKAVELTCKEKTMNNAVAWAVITEKGLANVCILQAVANDWASHHGGEVIPLFAKDKNFSPKAASNTQLLDDIQAFVDQTDPWLSQVENREYKIRTPEQRNARRAVKELKSRLA